MKWLKDKIQQHKERKAAKEEFSRQWKLWLIRRRGEIKQEILAEWTAKKDTAQRDYEKARAIYRRNPFDPQAVIAYEDARKFWVDIEQLIGNPDRKRELRDQLSWKAEMVLGKEVDAIRAEIKRAEIESKRHTYGDAWTDHQLYSLNPEFCPEPVRKKIKKEKNEIDERNDAIKTALMVILAIIFFPIWIFLSLGSLRWVK